MDKKELIEKIIQKKEFSQLREKDVLIAFEHFDFEKYSDEEKIKLTRNLLRKVFSAFFSRKIFSEKFFEKKTAEDILRKHLSTRERMPFYKEIYGRVFSNIGKNASVIDLGAGINGLSYSHFKNIGANVEYTGVESINQVVSLLNHYFTKKHILAKYFHLSLFELEGIKELIQKTKKPRVIFLLKVIDSLEMMERNYSKKLISEIISLSDLIVISFATESMLKRKKFYAERKWLVQFVNDNFKVIDEFEFGGEKYIIFQKR